MSYNYAVTLPVSAKPTYERDIAEKSENRNFLSPKLWILLKWLLVFENFEKILEERKVWKAIVTKNHVMDYLERLLLNMGPLLTSIDILPRNL